MRFARRTFLSGCAAFPLISGLPRMAMTEKAIGAGTLTTISDGHLTLPGDFIFDPMPKTKLRPILSEFGVSSETLTPECNVSLYRDGINTVLFDVGSGPDFQASAGRLREGLDAAGVAVEDITHVVFTHAHPDHIWGLLDDFDDPMFQNATYLIGRAEWGYWMNPETVNTIGEARAAFAVGAKRRLQAVEDAIEFFDDGQEILPGVQAVSSPGHTPGHMSFEVRNGSDATLILGDAIGNHHVAFRKPDWPSGSDQDTEAAAKTRTALFDRILADGLHIAGFHLPSGGMGRVERASEGYRFVAEDL